MNKPYNRNEYHHSCELEVLNYSAVGFIDLAIGRSKSVDPLAGEFPSQSSYLYAYNNPVRMIDLDRLYGDESEANRQRDLAQAQGHNVGKVYKSGDEWGVNTIDGHDSKGTFERDFSQNNTNSGNESGSGFFSGLWSWFSGWVSPGSAQPGTDDGLEVMALGGGNNTSEGSASKIVDMIKFPGTNIPIASAMFMRHLSNVSSDAYNVVNTVTRQAETVTIGLEFAETFQSGMERREKNVVDTQEWKVGNFIIRHRVESYLNSDGKAGGANGTIIDTPYIIKY